MKPIYKRLVGHLYKSQWGWEVSYPKRLKIGRNVDIGTFTYIQAEEGVIIEDDVQIGGGCYIYSVNTIGSNEHPEGTKGKIIIKKGAKIGAQSLILPNSIIEKNVFIKAKSIIKGGKIKNE